MTPLSVNSRVHSDVKQEWDPDQFSAESPDALMLRVFLKFVVCDRVIFPGDGEYVTRF